MSLAVALSDAFASRSDPAAVPAASIAVVVDQHTVIEAWGAKTSTLFQAASISKPVAAMVALRLVADGHLDLDADVNRFLTSWQLPGDAGVSVTVRHLLCHGGGLSVDGFPGYRQDQALPSLADILDGRPPSNTPAVRREGPPGRESRYSGGGYQILQQLLEDVTGRAFADLAEELVLRPAGMTTATYAQPDPADAAAPHIAGRPEPWMIYPEHAAAGLWCTPTDLLHLAQAIQSAVAGGPGAVLPQELAGQMATRQLANWGLGLGVSGDGDRRTFSHAGGNHGYQCLMLGAVDARNAAAVMTNSDQGLAVAKAMAAAITASTSWQIASPLPAALAPFGQVRALRAERGVPAVARVDPGFVGQPVEHLRYHALVQGRETRRVFLGVADAAGEQAATGAFAGRRRRAVASLPLVCPCWPAQTARWCLSGTVHR